MRKLPLLLLLLLGCAKESDKVAVPEDLPVDLSVEATVTSLDGSQVFTVPQPDDEEWDDYLEMLRHPQFQSRLQGQPGYTKVYDPEWRSVVEGKRDAPPSDLVLRPSYESREQLVGELLAALQRNDALALQTMHVQEHEYTELCWPSFPQSRPYARIPVNEAWAFHYGHCNGGVREALRKLGGRDWVLEALQYGERKDYGNFTLIRDVRLLLVDAESGERVQTRFVDSFIERDGRTKVYLFKD